jgi:hypothetical protein
MVSRHRAHNRGVGPFLFSVPENKSVQTTQQLRNLTGISALRFLSAMRVGSEGEAALLLSGQGAARRSEQFHSETTGDERQQTYGDIHHREPS